MLSSLDALAGKISPGSGKNSPKQQNNYQDNNNTTTIATKTHHFNQNTHPYQKVDHITNREK